MTLLSLKVWVVTTHVHDFFWNIHILNWVINWLLLFKDVYLRNHLSITLQACSNDNLLHWDINLRVCLDWFLECLIFKIIHFKINWGVWHSFEIIFAKMRLWNKSFQRKYMQPNFRIIFYFMFNEISLPNIYFSSFIFSISFYYLFVFFSIFKYF